MTTLVASKALALSLIYLRNPLSIIESLEVTFLKNQNDRSLESYVVQIVEESAIAASLPVPRVCVIEDDMSINSFVLGCDQSNSIIGVTRGFLDCLNYQEMQAVIAYQLCKAQSGEIRNDILILSLVEAFNSLSAAGKIIFLNIGMHRSNFLSLLGYALYLFGLPGVIFSAIVNLLTSSRTVMVFDKAAVGFSGSSQALQSVLKKIAALKLNSNQGVLNELSHLFFVANAYSFSHPSIRKRILALDRKWDGVFPEVRKIKYADSKFSHESHDSRMLSFIETRNENNKITFFRQILSEIPEVISTRMRNPFGVRALLLVMLLDKKPANQTKQMELILNVNDSQLYQDVLSDKALLQYINKEHYVPIIRVANVVLKGLPKNKYQSFIKLVYQLISLDKQVTLFEYCMYEILVPSTTLGASKLSYQEAVQILKKSLRDEHFEYSLVDSAVKSVLKEEAKTKSALISELVELISKDGLVTSFEEQYIAAISSALGVELLH